MKLTFVCVAIAIAPVGSLLADTPKTEVVVGHLLPEEDGKSDRGPSVLKSPFGVDFDPAGNVIIVELEGGRVHRYDAEGVIETIAGSAKAGYRGDGQPAEQALFNGMHNVAVAANGDIYISDTWNHCVRKIDGRSGIIDTIAGTGKAGFAGDGGPAKEAQFDYVMCVTLDPKNQRLFIADTNNRRIRVLDLERNTVETVAGNGEKGEPTDGSEARRSPLVDPRAVAIDSEDRIYILERGGHALRVVTPDGHIQTVAGNGQAGKGDGQGTAARLNSPKHLCVDAHDNVYIADEGNHLIRKFDPQTGQVTTVLGEKRGIPPIVLKQPHGVCVRDGVLYVVDSGHDRILRVEE